VRGIERDLLPVAQAYGMGVISWSPLAGGWLSGQYGEGKTNTSRRSERLPARYDLAVPENQKKLEVVNQLTKLAEETNLSLVHLALGFVLEHPAVTSAIIGPRTMEQLESQLDAADLRLEASVLDRIDEIVPPGTNLNPGDAGWIPTSLTDAMKRRRPRT
jgi:aryl-alcohol dehydrogenase-like predicted oxidoreductase